MENAVFSVWRALFPQKMQDKTCKCRILQDFLGEMDEKSTENLLFSNETFVKYPH